MKKLERLKTLQLIVFFAIALLCIYILIIKSDTYYQIAESRELQTLVTLLWVILFSTFVFIFLDFTLFARQKSDYNALDYAVHSDPLAKIANRQGCDEIIEKYIDQPLPDDMGVAMFLLTSLNDINRYHNRMLGNKQIRNFSIILKLASTNVCFVGRNGGNVFMAIFEECATDNMDVFLSRIEEKVVEYNNDKESLPMYYTLGTSLKTRDTEPETINGLISLASRRAHESATFPAGTARIMDISSDTSSDAPFEGTEAAGEEPATVLQTEIITHEDTDVIEPVHHQPKIPSFAIAAKIIYVAEATITKTADDYKYTDSEKYGPRQDFEQYTFVSFREAV